MRRDLHEFPGRRSRRIVARKWAFWMGLFPSLLQSEILFLSGQRISRNSSPLGETSRRSPDHAFRQPHCDSGARSSSGADFLLFGGIRDIIRRCKPGSRERVDRPQWWNTSPRRVRQIFFAGSNPVETSLPFLKMVGTAGLAGLRSACLRLQARCGSNSVLHPVPASRWREVLSFVSDGRDDWIVRFLWKPTC